MQILQLMKIFIDIYLQIWFFDNYFNGKTDSIVLVCPATDSYKEQGRSFSFSWKLPKSLGDKIIAS